MNGYTRCSIYTIEYYSAKKKTLAIWDNMDGPRRYYAKCNDKDEYSVISLICGI